jgi:hypothetical protein
MSRPIHNIRITQGFNLGWNRMSISGDGFNGDFCFIMSARIASIGLISAPCVFTGTENSFYTIVNGIKYSLTLVDKFDPSTLNNGECSYIVAYSITNSTEFNNPQYYSLKIMTSTTMTISNLNGDTASINIPNILQSQKYFIKVVDFVESNNIVDAFFSSPISTTLPTLPPISLPNNMASLNSTRILPEIFNSGRYRFEGYASSNADAPFLNILGSSPSLNMILDKVGDVTFGIDVVATGTISQTNNNFTVNLSPNIEQIWYPIFFIGYEDNYTDDIAGRFSVRFDWFFCDTRLASGNNKLILNSESQTSNLSLTSQMPSDPSISNGKTWISIPDYTSYYQFIDPSNYLSTKFKSLDGPYIHSAFDNSNTNSGHTILSIHDWDVLPSSTSLSSIDFTKSRMLGDFILDAIITDNHLNTTYNMSVNINCK